MKSESNRDDIYQLYSAVKHAFTIWSWQKEKKFGLNSKKNKYTSIKHDYCKRYSAKCFIFLDKTMKSAWETATESLNM